jgi:hypothetical protein
VHAIVHKEWCSLVIHQTLCETRNRHAQTNIARYGLFACSPFSEIRIQKVKMTSSSSFHSEKTAVNHKPPLTMSSSSTTLDHSTDPAQEPPSEQSQVAKSVDEDHKEPHSGNAEVIRDIIIGAADGLTVPFALTAGLSSQVPPAPLPSNLADK